MKNVFIFVVQTNSMMIWKENMPKQIAIIQRQCMSVFSKHIRFRIVTNIEKQAMKPFGTQSLSIVGT